MHYLLHKIIKHYLIFEELVSLFIYLEFLFIIKCNIVHLIFIIIN